MFTRRKIGRKVANIRSVRVGAKVFNFLAPLKDVRGNSFVSRLRTTIGEGKRRSREPVGKLVKGRPFHFPNEFKDGREKSGKRRVNGGCRNELETFVKKREAVRS